MTTDKVGRTVRALDYVLRRRPDGVQLSELAQVLDVPLSSTHDLLRSMVAAGLFQFDRDKQYRVGPTFLRLALKAVDSVDVRTVARPHLQKLVRTVQHDAYLAVRVGDVVTYVERIPGLNRAGLDITLGDPIPLHSSAVGKLFAALSPDLREGVMSAERVRYTVHTITDAAHLGKALDDIRERTVSISHEETISGIIGLAVPVWGPGRKLAAAVHLSAFKDAVGEGEIPILVHHLQDTARDIQDAIGTQTVAERNNDDAVA